MSGPTPGPFTDVVPTFSLVSPVHSPMPEPAPPIGAITEPVPMTLELQPFDFDRVAHPLPPLPFPVRPHTFHFSETNGDDEQPDEPTQPDEPPPPSLLPDPPPPEQPAA